MATSKAYRLNVDYTAATQVTVDNSPSGSKTAFIPSFSVTAADGSAVDMAAMVAAIGNPDDAAYTGTGDGTVIAILKGIYANTAA
jgi:hypothetical protein